MKVYGGHAYTVEDPTFAGSVFDMSASTTTGNLYGIWFQASNVSAVTSNAVIVGNTFIAPSDASCNPVHAEDDAGTMSGIKAGTNEVTNWTHPYQGSMDARLSRTVTLSAGVGSYNFQNRFSAAPVCAATDTTSAAAVKAMSSTTALTLAGTGTDVIAWSCSPAQN